MMPLPQGLGDSVQQENNQQDNARQNMWHKAVWMGHPMKLKLTHKYLLV